MTNSDSEATLSEAQKDLCRDIRALSDVELLEFLTDIRRMEREPRIALAYQRDQHITPRGAVVAHDPLCPEDWFCICSYLYEADARAREQAAQRVNWALVKHFNEATPVVHIAVTAARGGEQA